MAADPDELPARLAELEAAIDELQNELDRSTGPFGLPRPPTPRDLLRMTDEVAIPSVIVALETSIKALKITQRALRLAENADRDESRPPLTTETTRFGQETLNQLDRVVNEFRSLIDEGVPQNDEANEILTQARSLRDDIYDHLDQAPSPESDVESEPYPETDADPVSIDVDAELESLKDELDDDPDEDQTPRS